MLRITQSTQPDSPIRLIVEGRITAQVAGDLRAACRDHLGGAPVVVDLAGVRFMDAAGADAVRDLERRGAVVIGGSSFVTALLRRPAETTTTSDDFDEAALVARLRAGDDQAFEVLVRRHGGRMLAAARRLLRDDEAARDALQEAFLSAFTAIDRFDGRSRLSTWLHRIVLNCALMRLRRGRRRPEQPIDDLLPRFADDGHWVAAAPEETDESHALLERRETQTVVRACIDRLPESYRTVLVLRDIEELDTREVADRLDLTTNAVKVRLHRARQALRTLLERENVRPDAPTPAPADRSLVA
jgi:RNA polymerase sigma-70 factor (ECF subfamily)